MTTTGPTMSLKFWVFSASKAECFAKRKYVFSTLKKFSGIKLSAVSSKSESAANSRLNASASAELQASEELSKVIAPGTPSTLHSLWENYEQSPWFDNLKRPVTFLQREIDIGIRGVTSNPTIFQKAIMGSDLYDEQFRILTKSGKSVEESYWEMVISDIQEAADLFKPIYDGSNRLDGFVSVEVSPNLAHDGPGTVASAKDLHDRVGRDNVYIKIPATLDCLQAIEEVIAAGISVNVTLIFSNSRYDAVMEAYITGLEAVEGDLSNISSVASFFVSRVDALVDSKLVQIGTEEAKGLMGKAAIAQCKLAYELYQNIFSGPRWEALVKRGANPQRLLWASTGVKNPSYPDTLYIDSLIGPGTVNTMPESAVEAFYDHGKLNRTIDVDVEEAAAVYSKVDKLGITWERTGLQLEEEGVASFKKSFDDLICSLQKKAGALVN